jgi:hypothetical protein
MTQKSDAGALKIPAPLFPPLYFEIMVWFWSYSCSVFAALCAASSAPFSTLERGELTGLLVVWVRGSGLLTGTLFDVSTM